MAIEFYYREMDAEQEGANLLIERGEAYFLSSYLDGERQVVALECASDGQSGLLKVMPAEQCFEAENPDYIDAEHMPEPIEVLEVAQGRPEEMVIVTKTGQLAVIGARFAPDNKITTSFLIPEGLMFPDRPLNIKRDEPATALEHSSDGAIDIMEDFTLPYDADQTWCEDFNQRYGRKGLRMTLDSNYFMVESPAGQRGPKSLNTYLLSNPRDHDEVQVDGEIIGAKYLAWWDDESSAMEYGVYAILKDLKEAERNKAIGDRHREVLVPMHDAGEITVYKESL
jgi:hypothetical protein